MSKRGRLLVVDDKPNMLSLLEQILGKHHVVVTASNGQQALDLLTREQFDVVLTDVRMPGADGFAVARRVKERSPSTEVIVMTAFASIEAAVDAIKLGAFDYVQKPFDPDDVVLVVARALEHARARDPGTRNPAEPLIAVPFRDAVNRARDNTSRDYLAAILRTYGGNVTHAAKHAGLERESLHRLLKRYGLRAEDFRSPTDGESTELGEDDPQK